MDKQPNSTPSLRGSTAPGPLAKPRRRKARGLYSSLNVLRTESSSDFAQLLADFIQDIRPANAFEKTRVHDITSDTWDIMRYRRIINGRLNNALKPALTKILCHLELTRSAAENLASQWLYFPESKRQVMSLLQESGFDESAIEAEAFRLVADDLRNIYQMLDAAQARRERTLKSIAKYRKIFQDQLRRSSDRFIAADQNFKGAIN
jgi:hypothetical protein